MSGRLPRLILVTDPAYEDALIERVVEAALTALPPGTLAVQLRDKRRDRLRVRALAERLRAITARGGGLMVINGDPVMVREVEADGVHLGGGAMAVAEARRILPSAWISVAAHFDDDVHRALEAGADAVLVSPIHATPGKGEGRGLGAVVTARALAGPELRVYALGGVRAANAQDCKVAGADGVAVIRAVMDARDPGAQAAALAAPFLSLGT